MTKEELEEYNRRHNVPEQCPLSDTEREGKIREVMKEELHSALDEYFTNTPFAVQQEQHYQDHVAMHKMRQDLETVKTTFLRSLVRLFVAACVGALSWTAIAKYIMGK